MNQSSKQVNVKEPLPTNKDRLCEQSEPQSYPVVGRSRYRGGKKTA